MQQGGLLLHLLQGGHALLRYAQGFAGVGLRGRGRGVLDVEPKQSARYAQGFLRYLRRIGCIAGAAPRRLSRSSSCVTMAWRPLPASPRTNRL